jgi:hypothetical protein
MFTELPGVRFPIVDCSEGLPKMVPVAFTQVTPCGRFDSATLIGPVMVALLMLARRMVA